MPSNADGAWMSIQTKREGEEGHVDLLSLNPSTHPPTPPKSPTPSAVEHSCATQMLTPRHTAPFLHHPPTHPYTGMAAAAHKQPEGRMMRLLPSFSFSSFLLLLLLLLLPFLTHARLELAQTLGSHMVLQRAPHRAAVYGTADAWARVSVALARADGGGVERTYQTVANYDGQWKVLLDPINEVLDTWELIISNSKTGEQIEIEDVLFGDVWLCSGQSNMQMTVGMCLEAEEEGKPPPPPPNTSRREVCVPPIQQRVQTAPLSSTHPPTTSPTSEAVSNYPTIRLLTLKPNESSLPLNASSSTHPPPPPPTYLLNRRSSQQLPHHPPAHPPTQRIVSSPQ